jgi:hypothetical protein
VLAVSGLVVIGGIGFAVTSRAPPGDRRHGDAPSATSPNANAEGDAGDVDPAGNPGRLRETPGGSTTPPSPTAPTNDPHACKSARVWQTKIAQTTNPTPKMLKSFNNERAKCINEGGHL